MISLENLDEQIRDVILVNGGDINIADHQHIIKDAEEQGLNAAELARRIRKVYDSIDWRPYHQIDKSLEGIILKGSISVQEAEAIVKIAESDLQRPKVVNYILATIKRRGFLPREKNSFEYDSFKNLWMTDSAWAKYQRERIAVEWLGEEAHSVAEMGEISLRKPADAKYFLRNTNYLVPNITMLTKSATKADEFSKIIEGEPNLDKRYLKVLYRLNQKLPFKLKSESFETIYAMFEKTASDYTCFLAATESYNNGHIHIWLNETDPINSDKLTKGTDYNSFLKFLYKINKNHPFYFFSERCNSPHQLVQRLNTNALYWRKTVELMANNQLPLWFEGIGKNEWITKYNKEIEKIVTLDYYSEEDIPLAKAETLIQIIDPSALVPKIVVEPKKLELLSVEGSYAIEKVIKLQLQKNGFVKAVILLNTNISGIAVNNNKAAFFSQNNVTSHRFSLLVNPLELVKNKIYSFDIVVKTIYEILKIPVEIKVIFPRKSYYMQLIKYAIIGALFFAAIRFLTGEMTATKLWIEQYSSNDSTNVPGDYFAYFICLVLFIAGLIGSIFLIKKIEKI